MYTYTDIKLQNQQDAFSAMFLYVSRNILRLCGERTGEGVVREAVRRPAAPAAGRQLERLRAAGVKTNLHNPLQLRPGLHGGPPHAGKDGL